MALNRYSKEGINNKIVGAIQTKVRVFLVSWQHEVKEGGIRSLRSDRETFWTQEEALAKTNTLRTQPDVTNIYHMAHFVSVNPWDQWGKTIRRQWLNDQAARLQAETIAAAAEYQDSVSADELDETEREIMRERSN